MNVSPAQIDTALILRGDRVRTGQNCHRLGNLANVYFGRKALADAMGWTQERANLFHQAETELRCFIIQAEYAAQPYRSCAGQ